MQIRIHVPSLLLVENKRMSKHKEEMLNLNINVLVYSYQLCNLSTCYTDIVSRLKVTSRM